MGRLSFRVGVALLGVVATAVSGFAQPPAGVAGPPVVGPTVRPPFSPYLNLLRQNGSPVINYYGLVRPQIQTQNALQSLQSQVNQVNPFIAAATAGDQPLVTGNAFGFQTHRGYFQNQFQAGGYGAGLNNNRSGMGAMGRPGVGGGGAWGGGNVGGLPGGQRFGAPSTPPPRR